MAISFNAEATFDRIWNTNTGGTVFIGNQAGNATFNYFADNAVVNDALYFGKTRPFKGVKLNVNVALAATSITFTYEYWNGTAWTAIPSVTDNTTGLTVTGTNWITFDPNALTNWVSLSVNGSNQYYVRMRITAVSGITEGGANGTATCRNGDFTITVTGYSSATPCTCADIVAADVAGGWGVATLTDQIFQCNAHLYLGDFSTATYFKEINKVLIFGSLPYHRDFTFLTNADVQFGDLVASAPSGQTYNSCDIRIYGNSVVYRQVSGTLKFYGGSLSDGGSGTNYTWWFTNSTAGAQKLYNVTIKAKRVVFAGGLESRRLSFQYGFGGYVFTNAQAVWDDVAFVTCGINSDPGYNPTMTGVNILHSAGRWMTFNIGTSAQYGVEFNMINCTYPDFTNTNTPSGNVNYRGIVADKNTVDLKIIDEDGNPIQGATVKVERLVGTDWVSEISTDSTATNTATLDYLSSWGNTSLSVSDGTKFTIGDYIRHFTEWYKVTNIVSNTLTITRAQLGTYIASIASTGNKIYKLQASSTTDANGAIPQVVCLKRRRMWFGTNTPAPYNTATIINLDDSAHRIIVEKTGYQTLTIPFTLTDKVNGVIQMTQGTGTKKLILIDGKPQLSIGGGNYLKFG